VLSTSLKKQSKNATFLSLGLGEYVLCHSTYISQKKYQIIFSATSSIHSHEHHCASPASFNEGKKAAKVRVTLKMAKLGTIMLTVQDEMATSTCL